MHAVAANLLDDCLAAAGGLDGADEPSGRAARAACTPRSPTSTTPSRAATSGSRTCGTRASTPRRSSTTRRSPPEPKTLMMLFKRLREIDVPEMMASIIHRDEGQALGATTATCRRQLWDEARHAMMGEVGFVALGVDWTQARITHNWSLRLNTECTPIERHAVLYFIEQGLMTKTGKRYEWEVGRRVGHPADGDDPGLTTGPTRCCTPRSAGEWYIPADRRLEEGPRLRRPVLVADPEQLGRRSATRA